MIGELRTAHGVVTVAIVGHLPQRMTVQALEPLVLEDGRTLATGDRVLVGEYQVTNRRRPGVPARARLDVFDEPGGGA